MRIKAKCPSKHKEVNFLIEMPSSLKGLVELYGEHLVYQMAFRQLRNTISNSARNMLLRDKEPEEIEEHIKNHWQPRFSMKSGGLIDMENESFSLELENILKEEEKNGNNKF